MELVFILSPARLGGVRAAMLTRPGARFELAARFQAEGASVGEVMSFVSGLYFRGKQAYARRFARPIGRGPGALVITPSAGLVDLDARLAVADLGPERDHAIEVDAPAYRAALIGDARRLGRRLGADGRAVLLGSIATDRYVDPLLEALGDRVLFPSAFVGRGDNSRGGLLLRAARSGEELAYTPLAGAARRGPRAARLPAPRGRAGR